MYELKEEKGKMQRKREKENGKYYVEKFQSKNGF